MQCLVSSNQGPQLLPVLVVTADHGHLTPPPPPRPVGGVDCHRMDLSSMVMLKDNHIWSQGSISQAVTAAKSFAGFTVKIDVECSSEDEAREAIGE